MGEVDMTPTQVSAALGLLRKTLPDLSAATLEGEIDTSMTVNVIRYGDGTAFKPIDVTPDATDQIEGGKRGMEVKPELVKAKDAGDKPL